MYQTGFGSMMGNYWMGLDTIHSFASSSSQNYSIRVDLWDCTRPQSLHVYEVYNNFWVRFLFAFRPEIYCCSWQFQIFSV